MIAILNVSAHMCVSYLPWHSTMTSEMALGNILVITRIVTLFIASILIQIQVHYKQIYTSAPDLSQLPPNFLHTAKSDHLVANARQLIQNKTTNYNREFYVYQVLTIIKYHLIHVHILQNRCNMDGGKFLTGCNQDLSNTNVWLLH